MSRYSDNKKKDRTLHFLNSLINLHVRSLMVDRGFDAHELDKGWRLLGEAAGRNIEMRAAPKVLDGVARELLAKTDAWENTWYPVADATLAYEYPEIHHQVFLNLRMTSGPELLINVPTLLDRLDALERSEDEQEQAASSLLEKRGLTPARRAEARELVERATQLDFEHVPSTVDVDAEERQAAVDRMWAWTKAWMEIARTVVKDKRLRVHMGLSRYERSGIVDVDLDQDVAEPDASASPGSTATPGILATPESPVLSPTPMPEPAPAPAPAPSA